jgi:hypothetical protein
VPREIVTTCAICGEFVRSLVAPEWRPSKKAQRAHMDMQDHLMTHSFAELLRYEIRKDLDQVPEEQRPTIVRDIYRGLRGKTYGLQFTLDPPDAVGAYSIDEALGDSAMYALWRSANTCGYPNCSQHNA